MISDMAQVGEEVLDKIAAIDPDILCVALGNPKQERLSMHFGRGSKHR